MSVEITPDVTSPTPLTARVAAHIRALMAYRQIRQSQMARRIGKGEQWLSVRLRGVQEIGLNDLDLIAGALEVEPADLMRPGGPGFTLRYSGDESASPALTMERRHPLGRPGIGRPPNRSPGRPRRSNRVAQRTPVRMWIKSPSGVRMAR